MINYQNGKVYKIINEKNEIIYIGSTSQELLCDRYKTHKHKTPNHKIILIENYPCNSRQELCMREQQVIEEHDNLLNIMKAYQSREDRKEYKKQKDKKYNEKNKKEILEKNKKRYKNIEKIKCEFCNVELKKNNLKKHQKRQVCLKFQNL